MDPKSAVGGPKPISRTGRDSAKNIRQHCRLTICIELVELTNSVK